MSEKAYLFFEEGFGERLELSGRFIGTPQPFVLRANSYKEAAAKIGAQYDEFNGYHKAIIPFDAIDLKSGDSGNIEYVCGNFHLRSDRRYITYGIEVLIKEVTAERDK